MFLDYQVRISAVSTIGLSIIVQMIVHLADASKIAATVARAGIYNPVG
jgi:hypothetical protein